MILKRKFANGPQTSSPMLMKKKHISYQEIRSRSQGKEKVRMREVNSGKKTGIYKGMGR